MIKIFLALTKILKKFYFTAASQLARLDLFISHQGLETRWVHLKLFEMFETVRKLIEILNKHNLNCIINIKNLKKSFWYTLRIDSFSKIWHLYDVFMTISKTEVSNQLFQF